MISLNEINMQVSTTKTMVTITDAFEGIASMRIASIRNQVLESTKYFEDLWGIYKQLRVDNSFHSGQGQAIVPLDRELYIIITAEGGLIGDLDQRLIELLLQSYNASRQDIIVIGHHGAVQLAQRGINFKRYFKLPKNDQNINTAPITDEVQLYKKTIVFYQEYLSLSVQNVKQIELSAAVQRIAKGAKDIADVISEQTYIFEPSTFAVIDHLERSMLQIALSQVILESKLAQYASRFKAMSAAHQKANDKLSDLDRQQHQTIRAIKDERFRETINSLRTAGAAI